MEIKIGDITKEAVDAIANAANERASAIAVNTATIGGGYGYSSTGGF